MSIWCRITQKARWTVKSGSLTSLSQSNRPFVDASPRPYAVRFGNMRPSSFHAIFARGGTSNGLVILRSQLPTDRDKWQPILAAAMGSPDEYGRQLNGMGSGISSTSKVCVIEASDRAGVDIDFTFVQVGVRDGKLDLAGNCGNMSSIVGPVALSEGLVNRANASVEDRLRTVRIFNTNTSKTIDATFAIDQAGVFDPVGDYAIDGVPGHGSRITLSFLDPEGAKTGKALPTGNAVDVLVLPQADGGPIEASLVDIANPGVFVRASDLGIDGSTPPDTIQADTQLMSRLEAIRRKGAELMGMDPTIQTVPKILILSSPGGKVKCDIQCRALSMQQAHKAIPGTLALNLGSACSLPGTIPHQLVASGVSRGSVTIGHPGGTIEVGCDVKDGKIESALLHRTARILMKGEVFYSLEWN
nr:3-methylitaconate isomerase [Quercus suber]